MSNSASTADKDTEEHVLAKQPTASCSVHGDAEIRSRTLTG